MARIVFDLDGTLVDSLPDIHALMNQLVAPRGLPPLDLPTVRGFIGRGAAIGIARLRGHYGLPDSDQAELLAEFLSIYEGGVHLTRPYLDCKSVLETLMEQGHLLGLCTNKPLAPTQALLAHLNMARFFQTVIAGDSVPTRKPDPAPLRAAFADLGVGQPVYVGDSETDAETAHAAAVPFLLFTQGYRASAVHDIAHDLSFDYWRDLPEKIDQALSLVERTRRGAGS